MIRRSSGILMHISSLGGKFGIGTLGKSAYEFVDFLKANGQEYWQILPINIIGGGNSPYQSPSAFAGNPLFIDLDQLRSEGYLEFSDYMAIDWGNELKVDYKNLAIKRKEVFLKLFKNFSRKIPQDYYRFCDKCADWLIPFSEFMGDSEYHKMLQYFFYKQWFKLKDYANKNGIKIIGDIPFYVSEESVDVAKNPEIFVLDELSGCPPDEFSKDGQMWGTPTYNWETLKKSDYDWWIDRLKWCGEIYDVTRIDHFRAFDSYYCIKRGSKSAKDGFWRDGPKMDFINAIKAKLPNLEVIAEDLGFITDSVRQLVNLSGYPNMNVLQFAFDPREGGEYLPHNYRSNSVVYVGTHDNNTILGWIEELSQTDLEYAQKYLRTDNLQEGLMAAALASHSKLCILTMQDILGLSKEARMNTPGTTTGNWEWRINGIPKINNFLLENTKLYGRCNNETT